MATSVQDIKGWLEQAKSDDYDYMLVVTDTFDWEDFPVGCLKGTVKEKIQYYQEASMSKVMEVYDLNQDLEEQVWQHRCWNI